jgi:rhamnosyltransferase
MKIVPIVVWYNPETLDENKAIGNIQTYSYFFTKVIIIDNSKKSNHELAKKIPSSFYIANNENLGIAKALNQGCEEAVKMGYDWVLTMDQDSSWEGKDLSLYLSEIKKLYTDNNISFSPKNRINKGSVLGDLKRKIIRDEYKDYVFYDRVSTSGNVLKLSAWESLNGFNEQLFIDEVDYDYCYRLREQGYNIIYFPKCLMNHTLGENKRYFFPHICQHTKERVYYRIRNMTYIKQHHPLYYKKYHYTLNIIRIILEKLISLSFSDIKYIYNGFKSSKKNIYGIYKE